MFELKPCPFCGGEAEWKFGNLYISPIVLCRCKKCHVRTDFVFIDHPSIDVKTGKLDETTRYTKEEAAAKAAEVWNRRVKE